VTVQTKIQGLVQEIDPIIEICKHEEKLNEMFERSSLISLVANNVNLWKDISFNLAIIINFLILTSFSDQFGDLDMSLEDKRMY